MAPAEVRWCPPSEESWEGAVRGFPFKEMVSRSPNMGSCTWVVQVLLVEAYSVFKKIYLHLQRAEKGFLISVVS